MPLAFFLNGFNFLGNMHAKNGSIIYPKTCFSNLNGLFLDEYVAADARFSPPGKISEMKAPLPSQFQIRVPKVSSPPVPERKLVNVYKMWQKDILFAFLPPFASVP